MILSDGGGEEGPPHQFLVRATFSSFSRPNHLEILVLWLLSVKKFLIIYDKTIFFNLATLGLKLWIDWSIAMIASCWNLQTHENDVKFYLGKTYISPASVMANLRDIK